MTSPWRKHVAKWKGCRRCPLADQRTMAVLARGRIPAPILFVGEAPGASEDVLGKPFAGPAGKLLDQIIEVALDGQYDYCITNLVACFPREAKEDGTHEPPDEAIAACRPRLEEMLELVRPSLVVCVGKLARKHLPKVEVPSVEILHPAAILRADVAQRGLLVQRAIVTLSDAVGEILD